MREWRAFPFVHTALKNLFSKPATTGYPFEAAVYPERMRGHVEIEIENCIGCGLCMRSCPSSAIQVDRAAGAWSISRFDCVQCGSCVQLCPKKCLHMAQGYTAPAAQKGMERFVKAGAQAKPNSQSNTMTAAKSAGEQSAG